MTALVSTAAAVIVHTPIWVWGLYAALLYIGFRRMRDSVVPIWRVLLLPGAIAILCMSSMIGAGPGAPFVALPALAAGGLIGWRLERAGDSLRLPNGMLLLRGEWSTLLQMTVVLAVRYAAAVAPAIDPALAGTSAWRLGTLLVSTALSALLLGRTAARLRTYAASAPASA